MQEFSRFDLTGQVALVTGAARSLRRAIALALARAALGVRDIKQPATLSKKFSHSAEKNCRFQIEMASLDRIS